MKIIDLTHTLSETSSVHPEKKSLSRVIGAHYENGYRLDEIALSTGIGTHMDAPSHFFSDKRSIDQIELTECYGSACVLHLSEKVQDNPDYGISSEDILSWESIHGKIPPHSIVFVDTGWSKYWGQEKFCAQDEKGVCHFPAFLQSAAELFVERKASWVGIDTMSIDLGNANAYVSHPVLLKEDIFLVENLANLDKLPAKGANIWIVPIKLKDAPEAPIRVFAILE